MKKKILLAVSLAILACNRSSLAQSSTSPTALEVGKPVEREIKGREVQLYQIHLRTGDFARGTVDQRGIAINVRGLFPDGSKIRYFGFRGPPKGSRNFRLVAELPGDYVLELKPADDAATGHYQIRLEQIQPMAERLKIVPEEKYHSPRLAALRKELGTNQAALDRFWQEIKQQGTPLVEPLEGDNRHALVTFLWRATFETHNVLVVWAPYSAQQPDDYKMTRLADSDLWYKTLRVQKGARFLYQLSPNDTLTRAPNAQRFATAQADPFNPRRRPTDPNITKYEVLSIAELPGALPQVWTEKRIGVPAGQVQTHRFRSEILGNERDITVYTPAGYGRDNGTNDLMLLFDARSYQTLVPTPTILDNLIAGGKIPPLVAVLVDYPSVEIRNRELTCNPQFAEFLERELLPWVRRGYKVTRDPARTVIAGSSYGGLAAAYVSLRKPQLVGNVLAQSGSFWWAPKRDEGEEPNWLARQYVETSRLPLRFFIEAGTFENDIGGSGGQILETSRHLRDVLRAKGYEVQYREFAGGHDYLSWRGSLADGLIALLGIRP